MDLDGSLPSDEDIRSIVEAGYERFRHEDEGRVADYIPALAEASPDTFGVCVAGVHGRIFAIGDAEQEFTIQSISKLFVFAWCATCSAQPRLVASSGSTAPDCPSTRSWASSSTRTAP